ncbi:MAG: MarR family transcriptional regulator [Aerococcus sp.]|nr:MarR family transcriptional regulator [Aerococcus sp.]
MVDELYPLSRYIAGIYRLSKNAFNREIQDKQLDIRATQSDVLLFVSEHCGIDQSSIAKHMATSPGLITKDLRILEEQGLIKREVNPEDSRGRLVSLTDDGVTVVRKLQGIMDEWWRTQLSECETEWANAPKFSDQLQVLYRHLVTVNQNEE